MLELALILLFLWGIILLALLLIGAAYCIMILVEKWCSKAEIEVHFWAAIIADVLILPPVVIIFFLFAHFLWVCCLYSLRFCVML